MTLLGACLLAWVLGGVPFGLWIVRVVKGVDIRTLGSGNVGATNASRAFGGRLRIPVFAAIYVLDFAKGYVPAAWFPVWFALDGRLPPVLAGACAVLGHCCSPFLRLRGGKGVATTTGVFGALEPLALGCALAAFFAVLGLTRQVFFGSLALGVTLAAVVVLRDIDSAFAQRLAPTVLSLLAAALLFFTHRSNLRKWLGRARTGGAAT